MSLKNHSLIKQINRAKILNVIRKKSPIARSQIADETTLDKKSITNFVNELMREDLIEEAGKLERAAGRPFTMLQFKPHYVAGVYLAPYYVSGVLTDLYGNVVESSQERYSMFAPLEDILKATTKVCNELSKSRENVIGAGICMPGILDMENGVVLESVNIPGTKGCEFIKLFSGLFDCPVYFEEVSRAGALAEKWFGAGQDMKDFVCLGASIGLGAGIVINRQLFVGAGHYAGEVGHMVIEPGGRQCQCGNLGCLEAYAAEKRILEYLNPLLPTPVQILEEADLSRIPKKELEPLIADIGSKLGQGMAAIVSIISPKYIILHGSVIDKFGEALMPHITKSMRTNCQPGCFAGTEVIFSILEHGDALGGAAVPLSKLLEVPGHYYV